MILVAGTTAINAWMMQPVLDNIFLKKDREMLIILPVAILFIAVIKGLSSYFQSILMNFIGFKIVANVQKDMLKNLLKVDLSYYDETNSGTLISRFLSDVGSLTRGVHNVLTNIVKDSLTIVFLVGVMFYHDWRLAIFAFIVFPVSIFPIVRIGKIIRKISTQTQVSFGELSSKLNQLFTSIKTVKSFNMENFEKKTINHSIDDIFKLTFKSNKVNSIARPLMETLGGLAVGLIIWIGGNQVIQGLTTPGTFFSFITALIMAYQPVKSLAGLNATLQTAMAAAQRVFHIIDNEYSIKNEGKVLIKNFNNYTNKNISIRNIKFKYKSSKKNIFSNFSLEFYSGKTTAIIGPSGSGKTTLLNLIPRFYEPSNGKILIGEIDIKDIELSSLRNLFSLVSQDVVLFDNTIKYNITYGSSTKSLACINEAIKNSGCQDFISKMPEGLTTHVGENGIRLSGGQRQRISIARAFLKDSPFLLLDEATSSLDSESEQKIQSALKKLMKKKTTLVIAHRLSTIKNADKIVLIENGTLRNSGTHHHLMKSSNLYKKLYQIQFSKKE